MHFNYRSCEYMKGFFKAKGINGAINIVTSISFITCFMTLLPFFLPSRLVSNNIFYTVINIFIAIMWLIISVGIYKKIQIYARLSIFFYIVNQCAIIIDTGYTRFNLLWPFGIYFFAALLWLFDFLLGREKKELVLSTDWGKMLLNSSSPWRWFLAQECLSLWK